MITAVTVPRGPAGAGAGYEKFARVEGDFATVSVAAVVTMDGGKCDSARVALGSCGPTPVRVAAAEEALIGTNLGEDAVAAAASLLVEACDPVDHPCVELFFRDFDDGRYVRNQRPWMAGG